MSDDPILAALGRLEAGLRNVRDDQTKLRVDLMDRMENGVTSIRDDIVVNMARSNLAHDSAASAHVELAVMWRKVNRIESDVREIKGDP